MASYAALVSLMRVIRDLEHHPSPLISLDKQLLDSITQHVTYFQDFLHSYISPPPVADDEEEEEEEEEAADPLEMRIANAAYAAEDAIEYHMVDCFQIESKDKCCGILQSVIEEMDSIKKVILAAPVDTHKKNKSPEVVHYQVVMPNVTQSETMVGSDGVVLEIMEKLAGGQLDCQVIPIVGMGGIGKTFLAKTIYSKPFIKERFDICAWTTISQHYDTEKILCELLSQATNTKKEQHNGKSVDELGLELHKYLFSRRFLIVMDDMWSIDSWDKIQRFFPNNSNGSRVLVTTRLSQLSSQLNSSNDYSLRMSFLDKASSWDLFSKTVFGEKSSCPPELEEIGEKIVDSCRGLPLSIAVVGGLLKTMDGTRESWESIRDNFTSAVNMDNDKHCLRLLKLSYNHLPVYLKPCFLYMGAFEEDEEIRVSMLVQLWVSEGFLRPTEGEALETTARGFLQELIDRNLILTSVLGSTGSLRYCRIHDLVRDMCLKECKKEDFFHVVGRCDPPSQRRRVVIPKLQPTSEDNIIDDLRFMPHTRSINCESQEVASCQNLVLLRTLQVYNKSETNPENEVQEDSVLFRCVNIRYLGIAPWTLSSFPSLSHLWNLHTLIASYALTFSSVLVADFWKMPQIRHFEFRCCYACLPDPPNIVVIMEHLHTLKRVRNLKFTQGVIKRIPNVKRLNLEYHSCDGNVDYFLENLKYFCALEFLSIDFYHLSPINPPREITFPHSLKKLSLSVVSYIEWDDMLEKISLLPVLEKLKLSLGCFRNGKWEIAQGQFPCLKYLKLEWCQGLKSWSAAEEDSSILSRLQHLHLARLSELKKIPFELGNIDTLESIDVSVCGDELVSSVKEMFDEQVELQGGEDQLSFCVVVDVAEEQQHLMSLAGPKFYVRKVMEHLHTLKGVKNYKCSEVVLERIPNVKRLKLEYNNCYDGYDGYFLENLKYLCALESLSIYFRDESSAMNPPREITFPPSLKKLSLFIGSEYEWDHMLEKIGSLPLLEKLKLFCGCFRNEEWQIAQGQFPCLKYLKLEFCEGLERLAAVEEDSSILPRLEHLHLISLMELEKIPSELGNIDTLKSVKLSVCADELVSSVKEMFDEQVELQGGEDQLSFHVVVNVKKEQQHLMSLACPKFYVHLDV